MTSTSEQGARHVAPKDRSRLTRNLFNTLPIVLVGSMAMSMNVTAAVRIADWIEPLLRRESYLALLLEQSGHARPRVAGALCRSSGGRAGRAPKG